MTWASAMWCGWFGQAGTATGVAGSGLCPCHHWSGNPGCQVYPIPANGKCFCHVWGALLGFSVVPSWRRVAWRPEEKGLGLCPCFSVITADALHALSHTFEGFQQ